LLGKMGKAFGPVGGISGKFGLEEALAQLIHPPGEVPPG
jgi:hypothetical protein